MIARLGLKPGHLAPVFYDKAAKPMAVPTHTPRPPARKELAGVDLFVHWRAGGPDELAAALNAVDGSGLNLQVITNRGVKVWPEGLPETFCTDHWRCRFALEPGLAGDSLMISHLLTRLARSGVEFIKIENLYTFDGERGYSLAQGQ